MRMILRSTVICALGWLLGMSFMNMVSLPIPMLVAIGAGLLLLVFPLSPTGFLLAYLVGLPFLDSLIPFFTTVLGGFRFGPQILFRGGIIVLLAYYWLINQRSPLTFRPALPMILLVLLFGLSTIASGVRTKLGIITLAKYVYWMLLLITIADMVAQGNMKLEKVYHCVIVSTLCFMLIVVFAPFIGIDQGSFYGIGDARGPYSPHGLALFLCLGFVVALASCPTQKSKLRLYVILMFCIATAVSIARTFVRTGYLSFFVAMAVFTVFVWRYGQKETDLRPYRVLLTVAFVAVIGILLLYGFTHPEAFEKRISDLSNIETAGSGRTRIYKAALQRYADFSLLGQVFGGGLGATHSLLGAKVPHNDYLVILLAGGPIGLALHFWLLASLWRQIKCTARATYLPLIVAGTAIAVFCVATITNPVIGYMSVMTCFSFLVGGAIGHYARTNQIDAP